MTRGTGGEETGKGEDEHQKKRGHASMAYCRYCNLMIAISTDKDGIVWGLSYVQLGRERFASWGKGSGVG